MAGNSPVPGAGSGSGDAVDLLLGDPRFDAWQRAVIEKAVAEGLGAVRRQEEERLRTTLNGYGSKFIEWLAKHWWKLVIGSVAGGLAGYCVKRIVDSKYPIVPVPRRTGNPFSGVAAGLRNVNEAVASLVAMGYSVADAKRIVRGLRHVPPGHAELDYAQPPQSVLADGESVFDQTRPQEGRK